MPCVDVAASGTKIANAAANLGTEGKPAEKWLRERAQGWAPYRGAAAVLAWHSYNTKVL